jgi:hypothetical protein
MDNTNETNSEHTVPDDIPIEIQLRYKLYNNILVEVLHEIARRRGIRNYSRMQKKDLIDILVASHNFPHYK